MTLRSRKSEGREGASSYSEETDDLRERVRSYWDGRIHDLEMATHRPGTPEFFEELEQYRFDKLEYLPRLVDFSAYRGQDVLEVGCGIGTDLTRFARGGARVTGVDLSETAIRMARRNFERRGPPADLYVADGGNLPYSDESFDLVYCHGVLQYAADPEGIVREAHRLLRVGGTGIFMVYNRKSWLSWMSRMFGVGLEHHDAPVFRLYTRQEFADLLEPFPEHRIVPERFPVPTRLHDGIQGMLFNRMFVPAFNALPRSWVRSVGWHLMAFCRKDGTDPNTEETLDNAASTGQGG